MILSKEYFYLPTIIFFSKVTKCISYAFKSPYIHKLYNPLLIMNLKSKTTLYIVSLNPIFICNQELKIMKLTFASPTPMLSFQR